MSNRRTPVKAALLVAPLLVMVLTLHAWGDAMAGGLVRAVCSWQYPERTHSQFLIRVPRRSAADDFAARALKEFVDHAVKAQGVPLAIQVPAQPVSVVLLDPDTDPARFGWTAAEGLRDNEGVFDATRRTIFVKMERQIQQEQVVAALRQAAARVLLYDAGSPRWSPWLTEGLIGCLDGLRPADLRTWTGDLPSVREILNSREAEYRGLHSPAYTRGARLLMAFLMERAPEKFSYYYKEERVGVPSAVSTFSERIGDPALVDADWRAWLQLQK
jgi:hypothetical protein